MDVMTEHVAHFLSPSFLRASARRNMPEFARVQRVSPMNAVDGDARGDMQVLRDPHLWNSGGTGGYGLLPPPAFSSYIRPLAVQ